MIDPPVAWSVADSFEQTAATIAALMSRIHPLLPEGDHLQLVDRSVAWWAATAADLKQRIAALEPLPRPVVGPEWIQGPPRPDDVESPAEAAAFFAALSSRHALELAERFPEQVGPLDGAPVALRYAANHLLAVRHLEDLELRRRALAATRNARYGSTPNDPWDGFLSARPSVDLQLVDLDARIVDAERWAEGHRQFLLFDPSGDGAIIEVIGELELSRHVAVVIPGVGNDLTNYEQGLRPRATDFYLGANRPDVAIIAWLGYDTPDNLLAATNRHPVDAAASLSDFLAGLDASVRHNLHTSVIGHSYGSLVTGEAMRVGARADEVVFIGSAGVGVDHVSELALPAGTQVWVGSAASDPIRLARDLECLELAPICFPSSDRLFFGLDPTDPAFGAITFAVDAAPIRDAHASYFEPGSLSLRNLTSIVLGQNHRVIKSGRQTDLVSE
ncbi:MAG: alpha/beta hydrolase family protein [Acidimicrobiia bacterium]|nr:alpha/beta hydrolase family protein [Acidimicrobiia bacterium]